MTSRESALPPRPGRQGPPPPMPKALFIVIVAGFLLATASGLASFLSDDPVAKWSGLVTALLTATVGIIFFASQFSSRRRWQESSRTELLRAVVTVVSALERRRREESSLDHD